jgi:peroxiredoxin
MVTSGDRAPDFVLPTPEGDLVSLRQVLSGGRGLLLVFLRHLG